MINRILIPDILQPVSHYCHVVEANGVVWVCLLYTSPSSRDRQKSRMPSSA